MPYQQRRLPDPAWAEAVQDLREFLYSGDAFAELPVMSPLLLHNAQPLPVDEWMEIDRVLREAREGARAAAGPAFDVFSFRVAYMEALEGLVRHRLVKV